MSTSSAFPTGTAPAAVIGGTGFIGSHLVSALVTAGASVVTYRRGGSTRALITHLSRRPGPATIFFTAGATTPALAEERPDLVAGDLHLFADLLDATTDADHPPRVVLASSGGTTYSPATAPLFSEDAPVDPVNAYGALKLRMERMLLSCRTVEPVILRLANVYGPGQRLTGGQGVVAYWLDSLLRGRPLVCFGDGSATRDYVYINDVIDAMLRVHQAPARLPDVINVGSGRGTALDALAAVILRVTGTTPDQVLRRPSRPIDRRHVWLDVARAREALGWRPGTALEAGIRRTWEALAPGDGRTGGPLQSSSGPESAPLPASS